jgi:hypothetical protein
MPQDETYNPLDKSRLAESVAQALLARPAIRLSEVGTFDGAGIYAIYYVGALPQYESLALQGANGSPIYVGQAIPKGGRKGGWGLGINPGKVLSARLRQHKRSIDDAEDLDSADFLARYLVVDDVWIPLAESLLIERFRPIWNTVLEGFGNHDPGAGRRSGQRPAWDTVHVGRSWASLLQDNARSRDDWLALIGRALAGDETAQIITPEEAVLAEAEADEGSDLDD